MTQPTIIIYTASYCPYCTRAKMLLDSKGLIYQEIDVTDDPAGRETLVEKAEGRRTVPQIFINDVSVGGFDDLSAKNQSGELDRMLKV